MKGFLPLRIVLSMACIGLTIGEDPPKVEHQYNTANSIGSTAKPDLLRYQNFGKYQPQPEPALFQQQYQARSQQLQQAVPYNHQPEGLRHGNSEEVTFQQARTQFARGHYQTPIAMVIIAQPAYIPASMLQQGNVAQQLLQYFQGGNSQYKYHYVPANHQPFYPADQTPQPLVRYQPEEPEYNPSQTQSSQFYPHEALPAPQALISQQPQPMELQQLDEQPQQLDGADFSKLAQQAAQHFISSGGLNSGARSAPAIITGLEHFSPQQQEKIKKQLSAHFGSPLKPLSLAGQEPGGRQQQDKRQQKFVPSIQVKNGEITQSSGAGKV